MPPWGWVVLLVVLIVLGAVLGVAVAVHIIGLDLARGRKLQDKDYRSRSLNSTEVVLLDVRVEWDMVIRPL